MCYALADVSMVCKRAAGACKAYVAISFIAVVFVFTSMSTFYFLKIIIRLHRMLRCSLLLPTIAMSVSLSVTRQLSAACSVCGVIRCSLCRITLASCYKIMTNA